MERTLGFRVLLQGLADDVIQPEELCARTFGTGYRLCRWRLLSCQKDRGAAQQRGTQPRESHGKHLKA
jgi:hypothetical protein